MGTLPDQSNPSSLVGKRQFDGQELLNATPVVRAVNEVAKIPYPRTLTLIQTEQRQINSLAAIPLLTWNKAIYDQGTESSNSGAGVPVPLLAKNSETEYDRFSISAPSDRNLPVTFNYNVTANWEEELGSTVGTVAAIIGVCIAGPAKGLVWYGGSSGFQDTFSNNIFDEYGGLTYGASTNFLVDQNSTYEFCLTIVITGNATYGFDPSVAEPNGTVIKEVFSFNGESVSTHPNATGAEFSITTY